MVRRTSFLVVAVLLLVAVPRAAEKRFITGSWRSRARRKSDSSPKTIS